MQPTSKPILGEGDDFIAHTNPGQIAYSHDQAPTVDDTLEFLIGDRQSQCFGACFPECANCSTVGLMTEAGPKIMFTSENRGNSFLGNRRWNSDVELLNNDEALSNQTCQEIFAPTRSQNAIQSHEQDVNTFEMHSQEVSTPFLRTENMLELQDIQVDSHNGNYGDLDGSKKTTFNAHVFNFEPLTSYEHVMRANSVSEAVSLDDQMNLNGPHSRLIIDHIVTGLQIENTSPSSTSIANHATDNVLGNSASYPTGGPILEHYPCDSEECLFICATRDDLVKHRHLYHSQTVSGEGPSSKVFSCKVEGCKRRFTAKNQFLRHGRVAHGDPFVCKLKHCTETFSTAEERKQHSYVVHGYGLTMCTFDSCGQTFGSKAKMISHWRRYHRRKNDERPRCDIDGCGQLMISKRALRFHKLSVHMKATRTECDFPGCSLVFTVRSRMLLHMRESHKRFAPCGYKGCKEHLVGELDRARNIAETHPGLSNLHCKLCGKKSTTERVLKDHIRSAHKRKIVGKSQANR